MTHRDRFLETLLFGAPDRIPFSPGHARESTRAAWHAQGLPQGADYLAVIQAQIDSERAAHGLPPAPWKPALPEIDPGVSFRMMPTFEEKILEHRDGHYIVQDWMGAITEIADTYDYTYIRNPIDFVTRKWHRFPIQSRKDWQAIAGRFDPDTPGRFPPDFEARCAALRQRDYPFVLQFNGPFWQLREFCGFEGLCTLLLEDPDFVREMAQFWASFCSRTMAPILDLAAPDMLYFSEDMCFKEHPMIGPDMTRAFFAPCYRQWIEEARAAGVRLFAVDSDGRVDELVPVWLESGVNVIDPIEVAAGNDIAALRAAYGKRLAFRGGVDKRAMAAGGAALRAELDRLRPVIDTGGFIPSCDHGVPPDVGWADFQAYARQLARMTGWLA